MSQLIGGCQAHLTSQFPSLWKEEPLGVCWLTGKVLTLGGRRGKPEQAVPGNLQAPSLCFRTPFSWGRQGRIPGELDTVPSAETVATRSLGDDPACGAGRPSPPPFPWVSLRLFAKGKGPAHPPSLSAG